MRKKINIIIPMAGKGLRFQSAGYNVPKPLIKIKGRCLFEWAADSFNLLKEPGIEADFEHQFIFIILEKHSKYGLKDKIENLYPDSKIAVLPEVTSGQADTCLHARGLIGIDDGLIIHNCDSYSQTNLFREIMSCDPDGLLDCFYSSDPKYSFAKINEEGYVVETAEKKPISNLATTGMYYYKHAYDFIDAAIQQANNGLLGSEEHFVAPTYNYLLKKGKKIRVTITNKYEIFGTPEQLVSFERKL